MKIRMATALAIVSAAYAATGAAETRAVTVSYRDLDLARPEGVAVLYRRVTAAAKVVCGPEERELRAVAARRDCIDQSIDRAIRDAGQPQRLAALK